MLGAHFGCSYECSIWSEPFESLSADWALGEVASPGMLTALPIGVGGGAGRGRGLALDRRGRCNEPGNSFRVRSELPDLTYSMSSISMMSGAWSLVQVALLTVTTLNRDLSRRDSN